MLILLFVSAQNDYVRVLNLSWNHLRLKGAIAIGEALEVCDTILVLLYVLMYVGGIA